MARTLKDNRDMLSDLFKHGDSIARGMENEKYFDVTDFCNLYRILDRISSLDTLLVTENDFGYALFEMHKMKTSDEDSKWLFPLEKAFNSFVNQTLLNEIDDLLYVSRSWRFEDYRIQNFQNDLRQKMEMLNEFYRKRYNVK